MAPARLTLPLDPIYQGATWKLPIQILNEDRTAFDLTGVTAAVFLERTGLPAEAHEVEGSIETNGLVLFEVDEADTADWTSGRYGVEVRLTIGGDVLSVLVAFVEVVQGPGAGGNPTTLPGAAQPAGVTGVVIASSGGFQVVLVDRVVSERPGETGADGASAYELAVAAGFVGTLTEWLEATDALGEAEAARVQAESERADAEAARAQAETDRVDAETQRETAEDQRQTDTAAAIAATLALPIRVISGTTGTIDASDAGKVVETTNAGAVTLTISNALPAEFVCDVRQAGAGRVTLTMQSGGTLRQADSLTTSRKQWSTVNLHCRANAGGSAAEVVASGDLTS